MTPRRWGAPALTLLALTSVWPAWELGGWIVAQVSPGGGEVLLRVLLLFGFLGLLGRLLDRPPASQDMDGHG
jgi:hypothetical protein